jgi:hypothetical protein
MILEIGMKYGMQHPEFNFNTVAIKVPVKLNHFRWKSDAFYTQLW